MINIRRGDPHQLREVKRSFDMLCERSYTDPDYAPKATPAQEQESDRTDTQALHLRGALFSAPPSTWATLLAVVPEDTLNALRASFEAGR